MMIGECMIDRLLRISYSVIKTVELVITILLTFAVIVCCIRIIPQFYTSILNDSSFVGLSSIISSAFSLIIGVEFVKMICKPTTGTIVEVLMFAIARGIIIEHAFGLTSLLGVLSIAILFAVRKYLFCDFSEEENNPKAGIVKIFFQNTRNSLKHASANERSTDAS